MLSVHIPDPNCFPFSRVVPLQSVSRLLNCYTTFRNNLTADVTQHSALWADKTCTSLL